MYHVSGTTAYYIAMTPVTDFVVLIYLFYEGPFETIEYTYTGPKMNEGQIRANNL
jgi:hypothetical protein